MNDANRERRKQAIEATLKRRRGMDHERAATVKQTMLEQKDLYTQCRVCGKVIRGPLGELTAHVESCDG